MPRVPRSKTPLSAKPRRLPQSDVDACLRKALEDPEQNYICLPYHPRLYEAPQRIPLAAGYDVVYWPASRKQFRSPRVLPIFSFTLLPTDTNPEITPEVDWRAAGFQVFEGGRTRGKKLTPVTQRGSLTLVAAAGADIYFQVPTESGESKMLRVQLHMTNEYDRRGVPLIRAEYREDN